MTFTRQILLFALTPLLMHANEITGNLLLNPGAETGDLTGWTVGGTSNPGVDNGSIVAGIDPFTGSYDFFGGIGPLGSLSQTINLVSGIVTPELIDGGRLFADFSFAERGLVDGNPVGGQLGIPVDYAYVTLLYLSSTGSVIGSDSSPFGGLYPSAWIDPPHDAAIPAGTRSIVYIMQFVRNQGGNGDVLAAFVDDNRLAIDAVSVPEPPTFGVVFLGVGAIAAGIRCRGRHYIDAHKMNA